MFDRLDLFREDTPTPRSAPRPAREGESRADQTRSGTPGQDRPTREDRARAEPRAGHRREHDAREQDPEARQRPCRTITERKRDALADVGLYRAVSYTDLSERHFDGHPYATRRSVNYMIRAGLMQEHEATGPAGHTFTVLTATERARAEGGDRAADEAKRTAAHDLGLHVVNHDQVLYPDAQLDIEDADGRSGRVNVEMVSDHYHAAAITAKAAAGYALHGSSRSATRKIARALARETDAGRGGGPSQPGRDGSVEL